MNTSRTGWNRKNRARESEKERVRENSIDLKKKNVKKKKIGN